MDALSFDWPIRSHVASTISSSRRRPTSSSSRSLILNAATMLLDGRNSDGDDEEWELEYDGDNAEVFYCLMNLLRTLGS